MTKMKTLKDIVMLKMTRFMIRQEAIKRVKSCGCYGKAAKNYRCIACKRDIWFNNITEEDLE